MARKVDNSVNAGGSTGPILQAGRDITIGSRRAVELIAVLAVLSLAAVLILDDDPAPGAAPTTTTPTTTPAPSTTTPAATTPAATTSRQSAPTTPHSPPGFTKTHAERWSIRRIDVDVDPPQPTDDDRRAIFTLHYLPGINTPTPAQADLYGGPPFAPRRTLARWPDDTVPDGEDCADRIRRHATDVIPLAEGETYCALSPHGKIVTLTDVRFEHDGPTALITVWTP